jgi:hypothetical protein
MASAASLHHRVIVEMRGIPPHTWLLGMAVLLLTSSCIDVEATWEMTHVKDVASYFIVACSIHPDLIPQ